MFSEIFFELSNELYSSIALKFDIYQNTFKNMKYLQKYFQNTELLVKFFRKYRISKKLLIKFSFCYLVTPKRGSRLWKNLYDFWEVEFVGPIKVSFTDARSNDMSTHKGMSAAATSTLPSMLLHQIVPLWLYASAYNFNIRSLYYSWQKNAGFYWNTDHEKIGILRIFLSVMHRVNAKM